MPLGANVDVGLPRQHDVAGHVLETGRTEHLQRSPPRPCTQVVENRIRIPDCVIGMQVRDERCLQAVGPKRGDALVERRGRRTPAAAPGPKSTMYEVSLTTIAVEGPEGKDQDGRRAGAEQHNLRARLTGCRHDRNDGEDHNHRSHLHL